MQLHKTDKPTNKLQTDGGIARENVVLLFRFAKALDVIRIRDFHRMMLLDCVGEYIA